MESLFETIVGGGERCHQRNKCISCLAISEKKAFALVDDFRVKAFALVYDFRVKAFALVYDFRVKAFASVYGFRVKALASVYGFRVKAPRQHSVIPSLLHSSTQLGNSTTATVERDFLNLKCKLEYLKLPFVPNSSPGIKGSNSKRGTSTMY